MKNTEMKFHLNIKNNYLKTKFLTIFTLLIFSNSFGQFAFNNIEFKLKEPPESAYRIMQTEKGQLKKIVEFNSDNKIIFDYRETEIPPFFKWKEPHRFIYANEYDKDGRIVKRYDFNSNAGLSIYSYEYGKNPLSKTLFTQKYPKPEDLKQNTNAYAFISKFKDFEQLKNSKEVEKIISSPKLKGYTEILNIEYKPVEKKEYNKMYRDTITTYFQYNSNGDEIFKKEVSLSNNETKREVHSIFEQNSEITEIKNFRNDKITSVYRFANSKNLDKNTKTEYSERKGVLNIRHYEYDQDNYLIKVSVYETEFKENLIVPITSDLQKTSEMIYEYNKDGLLEKEKMTDYKNNKKDIRKYKYQIEIIE